MTGPRVRALVAWLWSVDRWLSVRALDETHVPCDGLVPLSSFSLMPEIEAHSSAWRPTTTEGDTDGDA